MSAMTAHCICGMYLISAYTLTLWSSSCSALGHLQPSSRLFSGVHTCRLLNSKDGWADMQFPAGSLATMAGCVGVRSWFPVRPKQKKKRQLPNFAFLFVYIVHTYFSCSTWWRRTVHGVHLSRSGPKVPSPCLAGGGVYPT